ncbi:histone deacetylase 8-like [Cannabis sativa]|uniref:histone deacetylase 8-like n=1 Tax=Cannabis sativa TaxID=3483 RepID=UPI0029CAA15F|nr:histone deacetylase 8-like [Cannabis sativa]
MVTLLVATSIDPASINPANVLLAMPGGQPLPSLQGEALFQTHENLDLPEGATPRESIKAVQKLHRLQGNVICGCFNQQIHVLVLLLDTKEYQSVSMAASVSSPQSGSGNLHVSWHEGMLAHDTGNGVFDSGIDPGFLDILEKHPENSKRVKNMLSILRRGPISPYITWHSGKPALTSELLSFHSTEYINELIEADKEGGKMFCGGTFLNPGSWEAALLAAGTTLLAMKYVLDGHGKLAYALVRPPGHHAQPTQADGYCFLNNTGLAVNLALNSGCAKVAVIDIDVHWCAQLTNFFII